MRTCAKLHVHACMHAHFSIDDHLDMYLKNSENYFQKKKEKYNSVCQKDFQNYGPETNIVQIT